MNPRNSAKRSKGRALWEQTRGQRLRYGAAVAAMAVASLLSYGVPQIVRFVIDGVLGGRGPDVSPAVLRIVERLGGRSVLAHYLWVGGAFVVAITALSGVFTYFKGRWSAVASEAIARRVRDTLYDHLQHLPCRFHDKAETGDLVQRCTSDVETLRTFLSQQVVELGRTIVMLVAVLPIMLAMDPRMTLVSLAVVPVILVIAFIFFSRIKTTFKAADEAEGRMTARLQENLTGIRVVRAFARQEFEESRFAAANAEYRDRFYRLIRTMAVYWSSTDLISIGQIGVILMIGAYRVGKGTMSVGTVYAFLMYVHMLIWPVRQLGRILSDLGKAHVSLGRLEEILEELPEQDADGTAVVVPSPCRGELVVENLAFAHGDGAAALRGISLRVAPGETLAILGPSGSGKSTLIDLLLRFYDYEAGSILLDGIDIRSLPRAWVRRQIGLVMQEPFLYSKTVRENIRLGRSKAAAEEIEQAAATAHIHDSIVSFDKGYDTLVGERGVTLSGGQRQRVALARALLVDTPILILDDALSSVDNETERMILHRLRARHGQRTTIVIAHRLSTLSLADRVVVFDHGRVVQSGEHERLVREPGLYRRLWEIQGALEEEIARDAGLAATSSRGTG